MFKMDVELAPKTYSIRGYRRREPFKNLKMFMYYFSILALIIFAGIAGFYLWNFIY